MSQMEAGIYLDALVAEKVMGCRVAATNYVPSQPMCGCEHELYEWPPHADNRPRCSGFEIKPYSTDIAAAWEVALEVCRKHELWLTLQSDWAAREFNAILRSKQDAAPIAESYFVATAPLAICRAALKAVDL